MVESERYRAKAADLRAKAALETDPVIRLVSEKVAASCENLAEQLEKIEAKESPERNGGEID